MSREYFEERIHKALRQVSRGVLQTRLAAVPDRNLAIAIKGIVKNDGNEILAVLPQAKQLRVVQELEYLARLRITAIQIRSMTESLAAAMEGAPGPSRSTWIAPGAKHTFR